MPLARDGHQLTPLWLRAWAIYIGNMGISMILLWAHVTHLMGKGGRVYLPFETITITFNDTISNYVPARGQERRLSAVPCKVGCLGYLIDFID